MQPVRGKAVLSEDKVDGHGTGNQRNWSQMGRVPGHSPSHLGGYAGFPPAFSAPGILSLFPENKVHNVGPRSW